MKKTLLATSILIAMGSTTITQAAQFVANPFAMTTDAANFTLLDPNGWTVGGTNDVSMLWDGTAFTSSADYAGPGSIANITASSATAFFGHNWSAHDIQVFATGTYTFDTTLGGGNAEVGNMSLMVGAGQFGIHMLFDWNGSVNMDVVVLGALNSVFASGNGYLANPGYITNVQDGACKDAFGAYINGANCLWDGPGFGSDAVMDGPLVDASQFWLLASIDQVGGDGIPGTPMAAGGPFAGFNANFNLNLQPVPVPAAVWLFGSGLLGLIGVARRKGQS